MKPYTFTRTAIEITDPGPRFTDVVESTSNARPRFTEVNQRQFAVDPRYSGEDISMRSASGGNVVIVSGSSGSSRSFNDERARDEHVYRTRQHLEPVIRGYGRNYREKVFGFHTGRTFESDD